MDAEKQDEVSDETGEPKKRMAEDGLCTRWGKTAASLPHTATRSTESAELDYFSSSSFYTALSRSSRFQCFLV